MLLITACSGTVKLTYDKNYNLVDEKNGITYKPVSLNISPIVISTKAYATVQDDVLKKDIELFRIADLDPKKWIAESMITGFGTVYCSDDTLDGIDIESFDPVGFELCVSEMLTAPVRTEDEPAEAKKIVEAFLGGEKVAKPSNTTVYELKFVSDKYPGLHYTLEYHIASDGSGYIYDRYGTDKMAVAVGDVMKEYVTK